MDRDDEIDIAVMAAEMRALNERVEKLEANQQRAVFGFLGVAGLIVIEPLKRILTGGA
jgi:hypothetical protein